jgi:hypothetical protein
MLSLDECLLWCECDCDCADNGCDCDFACPGDFTWPGVGSGVALVSSLPGIFCAVVSHGGVLVECRPCTYHRRQIERELALHGGRLLVSCNASIN